MNARAGYIIKESSSRFESDNIWINLLECL